MIWKATVSQTISMLKRKEAVGVFYVLSAMVLMNFIGNVLYFQGRDLAEMCQPMRLLLLSYDMTNLNATNMMLFILVYPLLVVCPAGFSLARERQLGINVYSASRLGNPVYQISKYLSAFLTTMIVFTAPFLLEIILNCVSFPLAATNNLVGWSIYDSDYWDTVNRYIMKDLYLFSPYLYAVAGTLIFGGVSGLLGTLTVAVSSLVKIKYNVFLFLPVFVALNLSTTLAARLPRDGVSIRWYDYILLFDESKKNIGAWAGGLLVLVILLVITACVSGRKDCLS